LARRRGICPDASGILGLLSHSQNPFPENLDDYRAKKGR
jgi:hypothetical protein